MTGDLLPSDPMAKGHGGKREGAGAPCKVGGDDGPASSRTFRMGASDLARLDEAVAAGVGPDRSAVVRELLEAWASDDRVRRAVASWRARAAKLGNDAAQGC